MSRHNCPACNCYLGDDAMRGRSVMGSDGRMMFMEGLVDKNVRLAAELVKAKLRAVGGPVKEGSE